MNQQTARRLSWSIAVLSFMVVMIGLIISFHAQVVSGQGVIFSHQFFTPVMTLTYGVIGALVASHHPRNPIGWIFCATGFFSALNMLSSGYALYSELTRMNDLLFGAMFARWLTIWAWIPNVLLPITFPLLLFPDGKLLSTRWRLIFWAAALGLFGVTGSMAFHPGPLEDMGLNGNNPYGIHNSEATISALLVIAVPLLLLGVFGSIASIIIRFRNTVGIERAQLKWLAIAGIVVILGNILNGILWWLWGDNPLIRELTIVVTDITIVTVVVAVGVAILRYRLWDIDIIINRTLVYGSLTAFVIGFYIVVVGLAGALLQTSGNLGISLFATGLVAVLFQPLRYRLQRGVNRLMYGERDEPYTVLGRLSERLEVVVAPQSVLPTIVETVAEALRLPYAAITLLEGDTYTIVAEYPKATVANSNSTILPLVYQSEVIGQLILAPRGKGELFSKPDMQLLETIARHASIAAYNVRLTQDLQRSRERLVTTREEERRRLRRDLHDGLGPVLASSTFKLDTIYNLAERDPDGVRQLVGELKTQMQDALTDIRRIAYGLRPPALDELGLVGALAEYVTSHNQAQGLQIQLDMPESLPVLPAAVEVVAYYIVIEAVSNVQRHAHAHHCCVSLMMNDSFILEVSDDGQGLPEDVRAGVGMTAMRERAAELGGQCMIRSLSDGGTHVFVHLPLLDSLHTQNEGTTWSQSES